MDKVAQHAGQRSADQRPPLTLEAKADAIRSHLLQNGWLKRIDAVRFLAAGEYNENYYVRSGSDEYVFRINQGSQLGLSSAEQVAYEFFALGAVVPSGVTPEPFRYAPSADGFPGGVLLMEFLPGRRFDYARDWQKAARIFASIHALDPASTSGPGRRSGGQGEHNLLEQRDPIRAILVESETLLARYPDHPLREARAKLDRYRDRIAKLAEQAAELYTLEPACIVNTEVNSGNFIVDGERAWLVDWEKAVLSARYQDLAHFLVPTTTLWKSDFRFTAELEDAFLSAYANAGAFSIGLEELREKTRVMKQVILLRALSWCYMAHYEYTALDRALTNQDTFAKIRAFLDGTESLLSSAA